MSKKAKTERIDPRELLSWFEVPTWQNVFVLGSFGRQVTFASQQTRALNLVWALAETKRIKEGHRVAVVGAGLGGLTAAAGFLKQKCLVDLYEQASQSCPIQRGNDIRFVHPNILSWPEPSCEESETDFPFLNWTAASARSVIKQIDIRWKQLSTGRVTEYYNYRVNAIHNFINDTGGYSPSLSANRLAVVDDIGANTSDISMPGYIERTYDAVILAVGFGNEQLLSGVQPLSYWENDSLHQETGQTIGRVLVSGCGDGGLIDALRLCVRNFDHAEFVDKFLSEAKSGTLNKRLIAIEEQLQTAANEPDISIRFSKAYDSLRSGVNISRIAEYFRNNRRTDCSVTLNSPAPGPFSFQASALNRFATHFAIMNAGLHYTSGRISARRMENGAYRVDFDRQGKGANETRDFERVIARHGPKGVVVALLPPDLYNGLREKWSTQTDITGKQYWKSSGLETVEAMFGSRDAFVGPPSADEIDLALATYIPAFKRYAYDEDVESFAIAKHEKRICFSVRLKPGKPGRRPEMFAGILVEFVTQPSLAPTTTNKIVARSGAGIYNYDAWLRKGNIPTKTAVPRGAPPIGTLGCFAIGERGERFLISLRSLLAPSSDERVGDRIALEEGDQVIARLSRKGFDSMAASDATRPSRIVAAELESGVIPEYSLYPKQFKPLRLEHGEIGQRVVAVGRTSGVSTGRVITAAHFENSRRIAHVELRSDVDNDFSLSGDAGALVVSKGGNAIGLIFAPNASGGITLACPISDEVAALGMTLWTR